jgi:uncharacterized protein YyaL (SSP411 family)
LQDHLDGLETAVLAAALSGSPRFTEDALGLATDMSRRFWDESRGRFRGSPERTSARPGGSTARQEAGLNARAAGVLWELGFMTGRAAIQAAAARALSSVWPEVEDDPELLPDAGLAAARIGRYPVQMVLIGDPEEPVLSGLREASFLLFEPRRVMLSLDPARDAARIQELLYPAELAPVLFICVDSVCSPPIRVAENLEARVREILDAARSVEENP